MGFFSNLFSGGLYSISDKDIKAMTAKEGYVRFAFRYVGGHINYPSKFESVLELSLLNNPVPVINVYANQSAAGLEVQPGPLLFSISLKKIVKIENNNQKEFSGAFLIGGLGAILQETRYFVVIHFYDENNIKQQAAFGTTPAIKSEAYFDAFYKAFIGTITEINPKALSGEMVEKVPPTDLASQLEKLSDLKAKRLLTDAEFSSAKSKLLNETTADLNKSKPTSATQAGSPENPAPPSVKSYKVTITAPNDSKQLYNTAKELCKDVALSFAQAKDVLTKGTTLSFEDKGIALQLSDKYKNMGCQTELKEN